MVFILASKNGLLMEKVFSFLLFMLVTFLRGWLFIISLLKLISTKL